MVCLLLVVVKFEDGRRCAQTKQSSRFSDVGPEEAKRSRWSVECRVSMAISPRNHRFCLLEGGRGGEGGLCGHLQRCQFAWQQGEEEIQLNPW